MRIIVTMCRYRSGLTVSIGTQKLDSIAPTPHRALYSFHNGHIRAPVGSLLARILGLSGVRRRRVRRYRGDQSSSTWPRFSARGRRFLTCRAISCITVSSRPGFMWSI